MHAHLEVECEGLALFEGEVVLGDVRLGLVLDCFLLCLLAPVQ